MQLADALVTTAALAAAGRIPVFVPAGSADSFEVGQRFKCKLRVTRDLLVVEALERF